MNGERACVDCGSQDLAGPDFEGFFDCTACGAAWTEEEARV